MTVERAFQRVAQADGFAVCAFWLTRRRDADPDQIGTVRATGFDRKQPQYANLTKEVPACET